MFKFNTKPRNAWSKLTKQQVLKPIHRAFNISMTVTSRTDLYLCTSSSKEGKNEWNGLVWSIVCVKKRAWPLHLLPHRCLTPYYASALINHTRTHSSSYVWVFGEGRLHMGPPATLFWSDRRADETWSYRSPCTDVRRIAEQQRTAWGPTTVCQHSPSFAPPPPAHTHPHTHIHRFPLCP